MIHSTDYNDTTNESIDGCLVKKRAEALEKRCVCIRLKCCSFDGFCSCCCLKHVTKQRQLTEAVAAAAVAKMLLFCLIAVILRVGCSKHVSNESKNCRFISFGLLLLFFFYL